MLSRKRTENTSQGIKTIRSILSKVGRLEACYVLAKWGWLSLRPELSSTDNGLYRCQADSRSEQTGSKLFIRIFDAFVRCASA